MNESSQAPQSAPGASAPTGGAAPRAAGGYAPRAAGGYAPRSPRREGPPSGDRPRYGGPRRPRRRVCMFCVDKVKRIDYKDVGRIRRYISDRGKIDPRRKSGSCAKHQRMLTTALKRARLMALLPYTAEQVRAMMSPQARAMAGGPPPPKLERPPFRPAGAPLGVPPRPASGPPPAPAVRPPEP